MPGTIAYTGLSIGKESTAGTLVAATRALYPSQGIITIDRMKNRHEGAQRGTRSNITYETSMGVLTDIAFATEPTRGVSFNELNYAFCNLDGGVTPVPASAAITYTYVPVQTSDPLAESFTLELYSDTQEVEVGGVRARGFELSAARGAKTQLSIDWFATTDVTKSTKTTPVHNNDIIIPSHLWTTKFATSFAGLTGASVATNFVREWTLGVDTGYRPALLPRRQPVRGAGAAQRQPGGHLQHDRRRHGAVLHRGLRQGRRGHGQLRPPQGHRAHVERGQLRRPDRLPHPVGRPQPVGGRRGRRQHPHRDRRPCLRSGRREHDQTHRGLQPHGLDGVSHTCLPDTEHLELPDEQWADLRRRLTHGQAQQVEQAQLEADYDTKGELAMAVALAQSALSGAPKEWRDAHYDETTSTIRFALESYETSMEAAVSSPEKRKQMAQATLALNETFVRVYVAAW